LQISLVAGALNANVGELAVVDATGLVHAFVAWGADPATLGPSYAASASLMGVTTAGAFVAVPFPMPSGVAVACESGLCDCANPSPDGAVATHAASLCLTPTAPITATQVIEAELSLEIENISGESVNLLGVRVCQENRCVVSTSATMLAGAKWTLHLGAAAPNDPPANSLYFPKSFSLAPTGSVRVLAPGSVNIGDPALALSTLSY